MLHITPNFALYMVTRKHRPDSSVTGTSASIGCRFDRFLRECTADSNLWWSEAVPYIAIYETVRGVNIYIYIYIYIYGAASPTPPPPCGWVMVSPPPPCGCGLCCGALLLSDADFLWFLLPPPLWMCGWVMVPPPLWMWGCGGALLV